MIAGDRRTSGGYFEIVSDETTKVHQITDYSVMAAAGFCNVISDLEDNCRRPVIASVIFMGKTCRLTAKPVF